MKNPNNKQRNGWSNLIYPLYIFLGLAATIQSFCIYSNFQNNCNEQGMNSESFCFNAKIALGWSGLIGNIISVLFFFRSSYKDKRIGISSYSFIFYLLGVVANIIYAFVGIGIAAHYKAISIISILYPGFIYLNCRRSYSSAPSFFYSE